MRTSPIYHTAQEQGTYCEARIFGPLTMARRWLSEHSTSLSQGALSRYHDTISSLPSHINANKSVLTELIPSTRPCLLYTSASHANITSRDHFTHCAHFAYFANEIKYQSTTIFLVSTALLDIIDPVEQTPGQAFSWSARPEQHAHRGENEAFQAQCLMPASRQRQALRPLTRFPQ